MENFSIEDQVAASELAGLYSVGKRDREDSPDVAGGFNPAKVARFAEPAFPVPFAGAQNMIGDNEEEDMAPYPFFAYKDFSKDSDPDPFSPVTAPGRVPNFPAKMHAILSRPDLQEIIAWMPHGRSWRVLKPREFEIRVIPTYFEHAKFSSFIRQANGWGFRRITQGRDRNSYYNPYFLRGMPHLCKEMKRPAVAEKQASDPDHEPDLYKISEMFPVPEKYTDDSVLLPCVLQGGPKARMPIYTGLNTNGPTFSDFQVVSRNKTSASSSKVPAPTQLTPSDQEILSAFEKSLGASESRVKNSMAPPPPSVAAPQVPCVLPQFTFGNTPLGSFSLPANSVAAGPNKVSTLAAANQLAFAGPSMFSPPASIPPAMSPFFQASSAASQFAAGFAAATAMSQHQFAAMLESLTSGLNSQMQSQQQQSMQSNLKQPQQM